MLFYPFPQLIHFLGVLYDLYIWQGVEALLVIILGSVPTMHLLLKQAFGQRERSPIKASSYPTGGGFPKLSYPHHRLGSDTDPNLLTVEEGYGKDAYPLENVSVEHDVGPSMR